MQEPPGPRRGRPRRRPSQRPRPTQPPAEPRPRVQPPAQRERPPRDARRGDQRAQQQRRPERGKPERGERGGARRGRGRPRQIPGERTGTPAIILLDNREGEPDLTGAQAVFEGYFDFETGDRRRPGAGIPRLKVGNDRLWGFECWWRADPASAGLTSEDHEELEAAKKLLRGLLREARRPPAFARRPTAT